MTEVELSGVVSFSVLMQSGNGIIGKAPSYIDEKYHLIKAVSLYVLGTRFF